MFVWVSSPVFCLASFLCAAPFDVVDVVFSRRSTGSRRLSHRAVCRGWVAPDPCGCVRSRRSANRGTGKSSRWSLRRWRAARSPNGCKCRAGRATRGSLYALRRFADREVRSRRRLALALSRPLSGDARRAACCATCMSGFYQQVFRLGSPQSWPPPTRLPLAPRSPLCHARWS